LTNRTLTLFAVLVTLNGCTANERADSSPDESDCGQLALWVLPGDNRLEPGDLDDAWLQKQVEITRARLNLLAVAAEAYCRARGEYPKTLDVLAEGHPGGLGDGCRVDPGFLVDAWGEPYMYSVGETHPVIRSVGADGTVGTADDVFTASPGDAGARLIDLERDCISL